MVHAEENESLTNCLVGTRVDDGGALAVLDSTGLGAGGLEGADDPHRLLVSDLAEDDVAAVEPRRDDGGDEELGAVAAGDSVSIELAHYWQGRADLRVGASVGHGEQTGADVLLLEVLIGELLTVDGLATGALGGVLVETVRDHAGASQSSVASVEVYIRCRG